MTNNQPEPSPNRRLWLIVLTRTSMVLGAISLVAIIGGVWYAWNFINSRLAPLIKSEIGQLLGRPVKVGKVERFSLNSLRFDYAAIPATQGDPDRVTADAVEIRFDLWQLLRNRILALNVTLINPDVYLVQAKNGRWVDTEIQTQEGEGTDFIEIDLETIQAENADLVLVPTPEPGRPKGAVAMAQANGIVRLNEPDELIRFEVSGQPTRGGKVAITGEYLPSTEQIELAIAGQNVVATDISRLVVLPVNLQAGRVDGNVAVQLDPKREQPIVLGTTSLNNVTVKIENIPQNFVNAQGKLLFEEGQNIVFENVSTRYGTIPVRIEGSLNTLKGYNLSGRVASVSVKNVLNTLDVEFPFPTTGIVGASLRLQGAIARPILTGTVNTIKTAQIDRVEFNNISTRFRLVPEQLTFTNIRGTPVIGGLVTGNGRIGLQEPTGLVFNVEAQNVPGNAIALEYGASPTFTIGDVSGTATIAGTPDNIQTIARLRSLQGTYPGTAEVIVTNEGTTLIRNAAFQVAGGTVGGSGQILRNSQFQASVNGSNVTLSQFSQDLRGQFNANLRLEGNSFDLSNIQARGRVSFSQGLALIEQPLNAQVRWDGEQIIVQNATAPGFNANGTVAVRLQEAQAPQIAGFNLNVRADNYNLQDLGLDLPGNTALAGQGDFTGKVTGTPSAPNAIGDIQLENLIVNNLAFESPLTGSLNYQAGKRSELQVSGQQDRIAFVLDPDNRPISFFVRQDEAVARGITEGENLIVTVENFPIAVLRNAIPGDNLQNFEPIAGDISGRLAIDFGENIAESSVEGEFAIAQPRVGRIAAEEFRANISYQDGAFSLRGGELLQGDSRIALSGDLQAGREFQFQINLDRARIERVLQTLSIFNFQDLASGLQPPELAGAKILQNLSVGLPNASILNRLRRISEIEAWLARQRREREEATIPTLAQLNGAISGEIIVSGSLQPEVEPALNVNFDLIGTDWVWREYTIDEVVAQGVYDNGVLSLQPLRIDLGEAFLAYRGQLGQDELSGQLQVESLPVELITPFVPQLPVDVTGELNALVNLAGSLANPNVRGEIALVDGTVNAQAIETAQLDFTYNNARLNFDSNLLAAQTQQPVEVTGSIPVALPFASVQPDSQQISLQANVRDDGLALINLFTDAVTWVEGQGQVNIEVGGTLERPIATGTATVENATLEAQALPQPLTNVTGMVEVNGDRIIVESIQGQYNRSQITAEGVLPIFATIAAQQLAAKNPLTVSLDNLNINLKGLYRGGVSGNVVITDTVLSPNLSGTIWLRNGQILIGGAEQTPATETDSAVAEAGEETFPGESPINFAGLQLILDENVRITYQPILSFEAVGDLTINGTLDDPRPVGVISLTGGQVNLFTTQFTLDRTYEQTARFTPGGGLDPILNVNLVATVPEVTGGRIGIPTATPFMSNEIRDIPATGFSSISSVRVEARIRGPASELEENLELTSDPARSEAEIVALLGGSFVNALSVGQADPALGLAAIGGATLFNTVQGNFSELFSAVGISEFRLFPTIVTDPDEDTSVLGLAAEAVFDLTNDLSVSVSYVIATDEPLRYNLIYRLSDRLRIRGSTNFAGESRAVVEYETRF
jgi:translocation and assembly module TamB